MEGDLDKACGNISEDVYVCKHTLVTKLEDKDKNKTYMGWFPKT